MGWSAEFCNRKPKFKELNSMVDKWLDSPQAAVIDRSGWMNHGSHIWTLCETKNPNLPTERFIVLVQVEHSGCELRYRITEESGGPTQLDCPMRLIRAAEGYPPLNGASQDWRERVIQKSEEDRPRKSVLRTLRKNYPTGEKRLVLNSGERVTYCQARYRGFRNVAAYQAPGSSGPIRLRPRSIDAEATLALWRGENPGERQIELAAEGG